MIATRAVGWHGFSRDWGIVAVGIPSSPKPDANTHILLRNPSAPAGHLPLHKGGLSGAPVINQKNNKTGSLYCPLVLFFDFAVFLFKAFHFFADQVHHFSVDAAALILCNELQFPV